MKIGRPLPLEYLIVDIPTGFPAENARKQSTFNDDCTVIKTPFGVENRGQISELQVKRSNSHFTRHSRLKIGYGYIDLILTTILGYQSNTTKYKIIRNQRYLC